VSVSSRRQWLEAAEFDGERIYRPGTATNKSHHSQQVIGQPSLTGSASEEWSWQMADGTVYHSSRVVLCVGAILTPAILQRSGVGPRSVLSELNIPTIKDLPVGNNLGDHFAVPLLAPPKRGARSPEEFSLQVALRKSSKIQPGSLTCS
jgi:choline dehydrogenase-like flavoprotein